MISTRSPSWHSPRSSCAMKRVRWRIRLPYSGCCTRRSTRTTTVLAALAETTTPTRCLTRSRIARLASVRRAVRARRSIFLPQQGHDTRQFLARAPIVRRIVELVGAQLELEAENFLARLALLEPQVAGVHLF